MMNSTTVLKAMMSLSNDTKGDNDTLDIAILASKLSITIPVLVSLLTELEHRDEIMMDISAVVNIEGVPAYSGTVRLMQRPPDELEK